MVLKQNDLTTFSRFQKWTVQGCRKIRVLGTAMADDLESASLRQLLSRGWKYHNATFDLYLKLSGVLLSESAMTRVVLPEIRRLVQQEIHNDNELRVRKANIDLSNTGLTDAMLNTLLGDWQTLGISSCSLCLRLQRNRLTGASLVTLGQFVTAEAIGTLEELHATHQLGPERLTRTSVLTFLRKLSQCSKYPIWVKRRRCFRPVHLRLGHCGIEKPEEIAGEIEMLVYNSVQSVWIATFVLCHYAIILL